MLRAGITEECLVSVTCTKSAGTVARWVKALSGNEVSLSIRVRTPMPGVVFHASTDFKDVGDCPDIYAVVPQLFAALCETAFWSDGGFKLSCEIN